MPVPPKQVSRWISNSKFPLGVIVCVNVCMWCPAVDWHSIRNVILLHALCLWDKLQLRWINESKGMLCIVNCKTMLVLLGVPMSSSSFAIEWVTPGILCWFLFSNIFMKDINKPFNVQLTQDYFSCILI